MEFTAAERLAYSVDEFGLRENSPPFFPSETRERDNSLVVGRQKKPDGAGALEESGVALIDDVALHAAGSRHSLRVLVVGERGGACLYVKLEHGCVLPCFASCFTLFVAKQGVADVFV